METTLHRQLKQAYASSDGETEVTLGSFRIDAIRDDELIEIQCASLSALRSKAKRLLGRHPLRIVKPIFHRTRITRLAKPDGKITSRRLSPKRGHVVDIFDELIYFTQVFPHPNLTIEVVLVDVEQFRVPAPPPKRRRRWRKDYVIHDVQLESIQQTYEFHEPSDLLRILDLPGGIESITTETIAKAINRPRWVAQKIAYVLKHVGAIHPTRRTKQGIHYCAA
jgi:hypothetical protein